ncbi:hypothetical protein [Paenibacillus oryzisoli]|uniref:hypothetical protein n=1 Tax=Paenibacillus oryzisoli TaxID=1850517 RepID=UPI0012F969B2|nr:hypothetical protein [Paenibacillus oryzisoli]
MEENEITREAMLGDTAALSQLLQHYGNCCPKSIRFLFPNAKTPLTSFVRVSYDLDVILLT